MLSANAQAFSVRCLLQKKNTQNSGKRSDISVRTDGIPSCRFGETSICAHSTVQTVTGICNEI